MSKSLPIINGPWHTGYDKPRAIKGAHIVSSTGTALFTRQDANTDQLRLAIAAPLLADAARVAMAYLTTPAHERRDVREVIHKLGDAIEATTRGPI